MLTLNDTKIILLPLQRNHGPSVEWRAVCLVVFLLFGGRIRRQMVPPVPVVIEGRLWRKSQLRRCMWLNLMTFYLGMGD